MLSSEKLPFEEPLTLPSKPTLTVIKKGKVVSVTGYKKLELEPDKSLAFGFLGSLLIHACLFIFGFYIWQSVAPLKPAAGLDTSTVFNVELIGASQFNTNESQSEQVVKEEVRPEVPVPSHVVPILDKPVVKKQKQVIKPAAPQQSVTSVSNVSDGVIGKSFGVSNGSGVNPPNYAQIVAARISANKSYPRRAKERGVEGRVVVSLTVGRNGDLLNSHIISTDSSLLSNGVEEILRRSAPFPAIPNEIGSSEVKLEVPIRFNLDE